MNKLTYLVPMVLLPQMYAASVGEGASWGVYAGEQSTQYTVKSARDNSTEINRSNGYTIDDYRESIDTTFGGSAPAAGLDMGYGWRDGRIVFGLHVRGETGAKEQLMQAGEGAQTAPTAEYMRSKGSVAAGATYGLLADSASMVYLGVDAEFARFEYQRFNDLMVDNNHGPAYANEKFWSTGVVPAVGMELALNSHWLMDFGYRFALFPSSKHTVENASNTVYQTNYIRPITSHAGVALRYQVQAVDFAKRGAYPSGWSSVAWLGMQVNEYSMPINSMPINDTAPVNMNILHRALSPQLAWETGYSFDNRWYTGVNLHMSGNRHKMAVHDESHGEVEIVNEVEEVWHTEPGTHLRYRVPTQDYEKTTTLATVDTQVAVPCSTGISFNIGYRISDRAMVYWPVGVNRSNLSLDQQVVDATDGDLTDNFVQHEDKTWWSPTVGFGTRVQMSEHTLVDIAYEHQFEKQWAWSDQTASGSINKLALANNTFKLAVGWAF